MIWIRLINGNFIRFHARLFFELIARIWTAKSKIWRSLFDLLIHRMENSKSFAFHRSEYVMFCLSNLSLDNCKK